MERSRSTTTLVILGLLVGPVWGQVPSEVADWLSYDNARYGYEIRYPAELEVWPTGPRRQRDGRSIRIARREHAAPVPVLDIHLGERALAPAPEEMGELRDLQVRAREVEIHGVRGHESVYRWKSNGEIWMVRLQLGDALIEFHAAPGLEDFLGTVWWQVVSTFRFHDE